MPVWLIMTLLRLFINPMLARVRGVGLLVVFHSQHSYRVSYIYPHRLYLIASERRFARPLNQPQRSLRCWRQIKRLLWIWDTDAWQVVQRTSVHENVSKLFLQSNQPIFSGQKSLSITKQSNFESDGISNHSTNLSFAQYRELRTSIINKDVTRKGVRWKAPLHSFNFQ